ncbi:MAG: DinB family protein [Acidobacteria bacterium]|nr:DinB family protein [Acidobacteriota bacterium]MCL5286388.1 DinB family protein [Acidobacteriota bacterium]
MKRAMLFLLSAVLLAAMAVAPVEAQALNKAERDYLVKHLKNTRKALQKETKGLTPEQWNFKAAPDRWSVAECLEHITLSEDLLFKMVNETVMKTPAQAEKYNATAAQAKDSQIAKMIPDRSVKAQAPDPLKPSGKWASPAEMWKHFEASRKATLEFAQKQEGLRAHYLDSPVIKDMDGYQWLLFLSAHSERHTAQIREVKADANFPKKASRY